MPAECLVSRTCAAEQRENKDSSRSHRYTCVPAYAHRLHPQQFRIADPPGMTQMLGSKWAMAAFQRGDDPRTIQRRWGEELEAWRRMQEKYRLYPD